MRSRQRTYLVIQARNFGDAVISTGLIEAIGHSMPDAGIAVLTRPHFRTIFENNPFISKMYFANFPIGTDKRFGARDAWKLLRVIIGLRRAGYDVVTTTGDFRENLLGWLISPHRNNGVAWENGHPYTRLVRQGMQRCLTNTVTIPSHIVNIYNVLTVIAKTIGASVSSQSRLYNSNKLPITHQPDGTTVGFHMSASQECKLWPVANWRELLKRARHTGLNVKLFGAPGEGEWIEANFADLTDVGVQVVTGSLGDFFQDLSRLQAVVCLDSFSVHAAHAVGVPSVMINGANMPAIWLPPSAILVDGGEGLDCWPCLNVPTCLALDRPYRCVRDISVERVWKALMMATGKQTSNR